MVGGQMEAQPFLGSLTNKKLQSGAHVFAALAQAGQRHCVLSWPILDPQQLEPKNLFRNQLETHQDSSRVLFHESLEC